MRVLLFFSGARARHADTSVTSFGDCGASVRGFMVEGPDEHRTKVIPLGLGDSDVAGRQDDGALSPKVSNLPLVSGHSGHDSFLISQDPSPLVVRMIANLTCGCMEQCPNPNPLEIFSTLISLEAYRGSAEDAFPCLRLVVGVKVIPVGKGGGGNGYSIRSFGISLLPLPADVGLGLRCVLGRRGDKVRDLDVGWRCSHRVGVFFLLPFDSRGRCSSGTRLRELKPWSLSASCCLFGTSFVL